MRQIFQNLALIHEVNGTLLSLIPKTEKPENLSHFGRIGFCNVKYKLVTKTLATRLKEFMPTLISQCQSSFVPSRQSSDNILIVQEVVHSMQRRKGKLGYMVIKVDFEKVYDTLNWSFMQSTSIDVGIQNNLIKLILECISSSTMSLLWNGGQTNSFKPSRVIHQGDPIFPYIFVLCIENLSQLINSIMEYKLLFPIKLARNGPLISHLCFANDIILFIKATKDQAKVIKGVLELFYNSLGQEN